MDPQSITPVEIVILLFVGGFLWQLFQNILGNLLTPVSANIIGRIRSRISDSLAARNLAASRANLVSLNVALAEAQLRIDDPDSLSQYRWMLLGLCMVEMGALIAILTTISVAGLLRGFQPGGLVSNNAFYMLVLVLILLIVVMALVWSLREMCIGRVKFQRELNTAKSMIENRIALIVARYPTLSELSEAQSIQRDAKAG